MIEEAEMMLNSLNTMKVKPMSLQLNNLALNKRFTLLSSKSIGIIDTSNERDIMTRHQSERAHIKIYYGYASFILAKYLLDQYLLLSPYFVFRPNEMDIWSRQRCAQPVGFTRYMLKH